MIAFAIDLLISIIKLVKFILGGLGVIGAMAINYVQLLWTSAIGLLVIFVAWIFYKANREKPMRQKPTTGSGINKQAEEAGKYTMNLMRVGGVSGAYRANRIGRRA